jgi:hypothetical protein
LKKADKNFIKKYFSEYAAYCRATKCHTHRDVDVRDNLQQIKIQGKAMR